MQRTSLMPLLMSLLMSLLCAALLGCEPAEGPQPDNAGALSTAGDSRNALDWAGVYVGVLPCADCDGIRTRIELGDDGRFSRSLVYLGEDAQPRVDDGPFEWDESGSRITLAGAGAERQQYEVGENVLVHLDSEGERIPGSLAAAYRLEKTVTDPRIENRRWRLIELNGRVIEPPADGEGVYFELDPVQSRIAGNAPCNRFFGTYELLAGDRVQLGPDIGATRMACPELAHESEFFEALALVDNYTLGDDGILSLHRARTAPRARFRAAGTQEP